MTDLTSLTLAHALDGMEKKQFSSAEITDAFLDAIGTANPYLNAYVVVTADRARAAAQTSASNGSRANRSSSASKTWSADRSSGW